MASIAYGALALKPWEFGRLTPGEFQELVEGYLWRTQERQIEAARFVAPIINACTSYDLKQPVTVEMLLGKDPKTKEQSEKTQDEVKIELAKLVAEVG